MRQILSSSMVRARLQTISRRSLLSGLTGAATAGCVGQSSLGSKLLPAQGSQPVSPDEEFEIWDGDPPGGEQVDFVPFEENRDNPFGLSHRIASNIRTPTLSFFRASEPNGSAILILPGGAYKNVVYDAEGYEPAAYFCSLGIHVYVLKYRLPHASWSGGPDTPLQDAQRAMRLIRHRAERYGLDTSRILVLGFSAGGHLSGSLCQRFDERVYTHSDDVDLASARPDAGVLVYPVALLGSEHTHSLSQTNLVGETPGPQRLAKYDLSVSPNPLGPPLLLLHALDDQLVPPENSMELAMAARRVGVSAALHVFAEGGHGFGIRAIEGKPVSVWPNLMLDWADAQGVRTRSL